MKIRIARHTSDLKRIINFYHGLLDLEILGEFRDHDNYHGVFLGTKDSSWHLEFTISDKQPIHHPDADDLLIFYVDSPEKYLYLNQKLQKNGCKEIVPKNPYWRTNGTSFEDPDGFLIVLALTTN